MVECQHSWIPQPDLCLDEPIGTRLFICSDCGEKIFAQCKLSPDEVIRAKELRGIKVTKNKWWKIW